MGDIAEAIDIGQGTDPARLLALRLHALHEDDRNWVLAQMDPPARLVINGLLEELKQLGFSALPELHEVASVSRQRTTSLSGVAGSEATNVVDRSSADLVWHHLRNEPEVIRRCLCSAHPWSWLSALYRNQPLAKPANTQRSESTQRITRRTRQALISALAECIAHEDVLHVATRPENSARQNSMHRRLRTWVYERVKVKLSWQR